MEHGGVQTPCSMMVTRLGGDRRGGFMDHIEGFRPNDAAEPISPEDLRKDGFKVRDVICWYDGKGTLLFQNGDEFVAVIKK